MDEGRIDGGEIVAAPDHVEQLLAHAHKRGGTARRQVEAAEQLLTARLRGEVQLEGGFLGGALLPGGGGGAEARMIGAEILRQRLEESDARAGGQLRVLAEDIAGERHARGFATLGDELLAKLGEVLRTALRNLARVACEKRPAAFGDGLKQLTKERGIHGGSFPWVPRTGPCTDDRDSPRKDNRASALLEQGLFRKPEPPHFRVG